MGFWVGRDEKYAEKLGARGLREEESSERYREVGLWRGWDA